MKELDSKLSEQLKLIKELTQMVCGKESFFKRCRDLFNSYWKQLQKKRSDLVTPRINDFSCEALSRFWQLDFLIEKIRELESLIESKRQHSLLNGDPIQNWLKNNKRPESEIPVINDLGSMIDSLNNTWIFEIEMYTECFYNIAHRLKKIIQYYPELKGFEPIGVINVRNNLIEHPHGKNGITSPSFGLGNPKGPVLKAGRTTSEVNKSVDEGLYKNAIEFRDLLEKALVKGLQSLNS